jgi:transposase-like protein
MRSGARRCAGPAGGRPAVAAAFPGEDAAMKQVCLAIRNAEKTWGNRTRDWTAALLQSAVVFGDRIPN